MSSFGTDEPIPGEPDDRGPWFHAAAERVRPAGSALQFYGILSVFMAVVFLGLSIAAPDTLIRGGYDWQVEAKKGAPVGEPPMPPYEEYRKSTQMWYIISFAVQLACSGLIFLGGSKMKQLQGYGTALAGAILSLIPCTNSCCCIGTPIGIWALMVLLNADVKLAFSRSLPRPQENY
jgi:hypothetical protein